MATCRGSVENDSRPITKDAENPCETDSSNEFDLNPLEEYKMNHKRRGLALIFNQENFFFRLKLSKRTGTNADCDNLEKRYLSPTLLLSVLMNMSVFLKVTFYFATTHFCLSYRLEELNFEVKTYDDEGQKEVLNAIHEAAEEDHSDADCFLLVFLSHGKDNCVYTNDGMINIQDIIHAFRGDNCPSLVGKPKIFIFQACRGDKPDTPVVASGATDHQEVINKVVIDASALNTLPAAADFIMCFSVAEGFFSLRDTNNGSWYIQDLCELLEKYGHQLEFTEILTLVNRKVSMRSVRMRKHPKAVKQVPCFASMLTKKLYFR
ncbi:caspase-6-like isoform X1 [Oryzias melastigma]|uniref:caspase-6-like isoform X1 n=1 Tax=Oryzias melastigma TaxID=30732 RepID=UPI00168D8F14|nr:caspase-6-like isoform X1 [Oryzias melastigma]